MTSTRRRGDGLLVLLLCLALVVLVTALAPDPATDARRRWHDVDVGQWGEMEHARVRVTGVELARSALTASETELTSEVTLVLVHYEAAVHGQQVHFSGVTLHTADDRHYTPRTEFDALSATQPGFTRRGTLVFEVPDRRIAGAELSVDRDGQAFDVYSAAIRVDLGLTSDSPVAPGPVAVASSVLEVTP